MAADCRIRENVAEATLSPDIDELGRLDGDKVETGDVITKSRFSLPVKRTKSCNVVANAHSKSSNLIRSRTIVAVLVVVLLGYCYPVCSLSLDCDAVKNCICSRDPENGYGWRIECPNDNLLQFQYPIQLQVQKVDYGSDNYTEAALQVTCNASGNRTDPWSYIEGMDLSADKVYAKIIKLEIRYCPPVKDGWSQLFKELNLSGLDIQRFTFITDDPQKKVNIPPNFFNNMPHIEHLVLRDNKLTSIPDLSSLKNLKSINLRNNDLETIPVEAFKHNTQLNSIALTHNKISTIGPAVFPNSVEHLELNVNQISYLNSSMFANLKKIKRLFLNGNPLDTLDSNCFDGMTSLEVLLLFNSRLTQYPNFVNMPQLANLTISSAILSKVIPGPEGNDITTTLAPDYLPENTLVLRNLSSLENLDLTLNHFTTLPVLEDLPKLVKINLQRNELTAIESGAFGRLPSLKILNLSRNRIRELGAIRAISLSELNLSDNQLTELKNDSFRFLNSLQKLNLARNKIEMVTHKTFEPLSQLQELDLSYNQLSFSNLPTLYAGLNASSKDQYSFFGDDNQSPLRFLFQLRKLNLAHNNIPKLGFNDWTGVFIQINEIDLRFNKITHVDANELNFISSNLTLNLENNEISTVDLSWAPLLLEPNSNDGKQIRVLLSENPLKCDCLAYLLKTWKSVSFDLRIKNLYCDSPPELKKKELKDVPDEMLICDLSSEVSGCPEPCDCRERKVDKTLIVDCSNKNITSENIPKLDTLKKVYSKYMIELNLSNNQISDFDNRTYIQEFLNKTKVINLTGNNLTSTLFLERIPDYQTTTFAIANNPFLCTNCVGFQIPWRAYTTRINDLANVTCIQESSDDFSSLLTSHPNYEYVPVQNNSKEFETYCANASKLAVVVILPLVIAVILLSCLCIGLFVTIRYGWAIKAYLYSKGMHWCLFWERDLDADEEANGNEKLYDAFISYSHKDEEWVLDELVKRLEDQEGFKLCLHFRDWTPGDWIPDQIVRSVDKSRRTVVVLSNNFVESVWSRLEFKAAHAQALKERSNRVILIMLGDDLKESDVQDDDLKMYMKMNTFMKWNDPLFWHRLKYALPHRKPCNSSSQQAEDDAKHNAINKMQQRERAIKLDKLRAKLEQSV